MSVPGSAPIFLALNSRWSPRCTEISSAASTTWRLVKIKPSSLTMTPEPSPRSISRPVPPGPGAPKKSLNPRGVRTVLLVWMLTTLGATLCTMGAKVMGNPAFCWAPNGMTMINPASPINPESVVLFINERNGSAGKLAV